MKKKLCVIILCFIILILLLNHSGKLQDITQNIKQRLYGDAINPETGMINNQYFGIDNEGREAEKTTEGINEAIRYAKENNIEYLKLEKGTYLINGIGERNEKKGIQLESNITLDLNASTIMHEDCKQERYTIITIAEVENVVIENGIIIGDKENHDYSSVVGTHQWGFGVEIRGSVNVVLNNLNIQGLTGDGIVLAEANYNGTINIPKQIEILNTNISNCRRQGITIASGENVYIYNNEIYNIGGISPAAGIDIETDNTTTQHVENIKIYNNYIYNRLAIQTHKNIHSVEISENYIIGNIDLYKYTDSVIIDGNILKEGNLRNIYTNNSLKSDFIVNKLIIRNNVFHNYNISLKNVGNIQIKENNFENSKIDIESSNSAIVENIFTRNDNKEEYAYKYTNSEEEKEYILYLIDNELNGYGDNSEIIDLQENIEVNNNWEDYEKYANANF